LAKYRIISTLLDPQKSSQAFSFLLNRSIASMPWQDVARAHREKQLQAIPKEWLLKYLPDSLNVLDVPAKCGLLTVRELEITDTLDINLTLTKLAQGVWSSVEVTTAYYKRAIIAHQLVRVTLAFSLWTRKPS
jgi:hypothetical protein